MNDLGKVMIVVGLVMAGVGLLFVLGFGKNIGRLPGDINVSKGNFSFHFPIVTCIIVSIVLTLIMKFWRK